MIADSSLGVLFLATSDFVSTEDVSPTLPGADIDGNGVVGFSDFLVLSLNFGQSVEPGLNGDIDENGTVEFADFLILALEFGTGSVLNSQRLI